MYGYYKKFDLNYKKFILVVVIVLFILFCCSMSVFAADYGDIRDRVNSANSGDMINLGSSTYDSDGSPVSINGKNLVIRGSSDSNRATLNGNDQNAAFLVYPGSMVTFRYINFVNASFSQSHAISSNSTIFIENCTFNSCNGDSGGAIMLYEGASGSHIVNCRFINNKADNTDANAYAAGGAICIQNADNIEIRNSYFSGNTALSNGGAIVIRSNAQNTKIIDCEFVNNSAPNGGAIYNQLSTGIIINGCTFTNNKATNIGGAIYSIDNLNVTDSQFVSNSAKDGGAIYSTSPLRITGLSFNSNTATNNGGTIYSTSTMAISSSSFNKNTAKNNGGGIYTTGNSRGTITGSKFTNNSAKNGGGIYSSSPLAISSSSFSSNKANSNGGGIYSTNGMNITGGTISGNNAIYGSGVYNSGILSLNKVSFLNNKAKIFSMVVKAPNYVIKGNKLVVESYLTSGDNLLGSVYTTNTNVFKDGISISRSNKVTGATIQFEANNKKYLVKSSSVNGVATVKIPTLAKASGKFVKVNVIYNKKGNPIKKKNFKVSYKTLKSSISNIKRGINKLKVSDYKKYSKLLKYEKDLKKYNKTVKKSNLSTSTKKSLYKQINKVLKQLNAKKIKSLSSMKKTINNKKVLSSSSEKKSYISQLNDLKKAITNSKSLSKNAKKTKKAEVNKLISKVKKLPIQDLAPFSITKIEGNYRVEYKWSNLVKSKDDKSVITAKVVTKKKMNVTVLTNYYKFDDNNISKSYSFNNSAYSTKEILVDDKVTWVFLSNNHLKEKYKWYYQNGTISKYYKGTLQVIKRDIKTNKIVSNIISHNKQYIKTDNVFKKDYSGYVMPSEFCESDNQEIINRANSIKNSLNNTSDEAVANAILNWVQNNIKYQLYGDTLYGALATLQSRQGNCIDQTHLVAALMRAVNIPAKYVAKTAYFYDATGNQETLGHGWIETFLTSYKEASSIYNLNFVIHNDNWWCGQPTYEVEINLGLHTLSDEWCTVEPILFYEGYNYPSTKIENIGGIWYIQYQYLIVDGNYIDHWTYLLK